MADHSREPLTPEPSLIATAMPPQVRGGVSPSTLTKAASVIFIGVSFGLLFGVPYFTRPIPFESAAWKASESNRPRMVDDLLSKHILENMTRADVDALLGRPKGADVREYHYWAGGWLTVYWLHIEFKDERVSQVACLPD